MRHGNFRLIYNFSLEVSLCRCTSVRRPTAHSRRWLCVTQFSKSTTSAAIWSRQRSSHSHVRYIITLLLLLSTNADRQFVDTSFRPTVCLFFVGLFCLFVRLRISPARIKIAASNFAWWFRGVLGKESPIVGNFAPRSPKSDESARGEWT